MYAIVGIAMQVYNELGYGLAEPIYQECMSIICTEEGIQWEREKTFGNVFPRSTIIEEVYSRLCLFRRSYCGVKSGC